MAREYGTSVVTEASPEKVWRIWSDMSTWGRWNPKVRSLLANLAREAETT